MSNDVTKAVPLNKRDFIFYWRERSGSRAASKTTALCDLVILSIRNENLNTNGFYIKANGRFYDKTRKWTFKASSKEETTL